MDKIIGEVETTWGEGKEFRFKVDGVYYSNKFKAAPPINKGDTVEVEFEHNPSYKGQFWKKVRVVGSPVAGSSPSAPSSAVRVGGFPVPYNSDKMAIIRQNALTNAVNYSTAECHMREKEFDVGEVIKIAMAFADYTSGALDEEAREQLKLKTVPQEEKKVVEK